MFRLLSSRTVKSTAIIFACQLLKQLVKETSPNSDADMIKLVYNFNGEKQYIYMYSDCKHNDTGNQSNLSL